MKLTLVFLLTVLAHAGFTGSRVTVALSAIRLQASPVEVGAAMALYALLPMIFAVAAGRWIDRIGVARPMTVAAAVVVAGLLLPAAAPGMGMLYVTAMVVGTGFMVYHVALNNVVGAIGGPADRAANFSWLALGFSAGGFIGPLLAGFAIDAIGHRLAFLLLASFPAMALATLLLRRRALPRVRGTLATLPGERRLMDLLRQPSLRRAFIVSGLLAMGWDLYTFVIPLYGSRIGLSASMIGIIMGAFAAATFSVRLAMPVFVRRLREWPVIIAALAISGVAYLLFPFSTSVPLLIALSFLLGVGLGCAQPMIMAILFSASPPGREGEVIGVRTTMVNASSTMLPLASGALGAAVGMGPVFWAMAAFLLAGGWIARRWQRAARL